MLVNKIYFRQNSFPGTQEEFGFSIHTMPCSAVIGGPIDAGFRSPPSSPSLFGDNDDSDSYRYDEFYPDACHDLLFLRASRFNCMFCNVFHLVKFTWFSQ